MYSIASPIVSLAFSNIDLSASAKARARGADSRVRVINAVRIMVGVCGIGQLTTG